MGFYCLVFLFVCLTQHVMSISHSLKNALFNGRDLFCSVCVLLKLEILLIFKIDILKEEIEYDD